MKKKLIALGSVGAASGIVTACGEYPNEVRQMLQAAQAAAERAWAGVEANPVPVLVALGTFLATIAYHTLRGKSLRESVEVAATRVTVVPVPAAPAENETPVVARAKARATYTQLIADQVAIENRIRKLPGEVTAAEKEACYTEQSVAEAGKALEAKRKAHEAAAAKLEALRAELSAGRSELAAIAAELKKLAAVV